ncbi:hypothetical protein AXZ77_2206 [Thioclava sp. ES.031]|uniref:DUF7742 family protein n=1 Tax=Thioclava sp. ES.031 TaxID=1798203 RepID=UPI000BFA5589|nr:hypothetical protein [Thioclava sp. ES.031]PFG63598.1 hypothetical protein AXZ77_2206 [Thioclava sp. ES.031]
MRAVLDGDLMALARVVMLWPDARRMDRLHRLLDRVHAADLYCKRFRRAHPHWRNGSVLSMALGLPRAKAGPGDPRDLRALGCVSAGIAAWRLTRQPLKRNDEMSLPLFAGKPMC